ncbi:MAG: 3-dehydroquinate synthase [Candidatus Omnitrophica bacterium CG11_big_fil_rev_8_21_14_0_20_45_26]|uniref:3-dehydroquinate synthase n=1 Tax=Candidatus Abzuiibacterium crystallinum TaxID=1974748 RepID=A0A2H0LMG9_9BACT|nr:MAG: 3-dehydroquinate synthase [Candidatus Omnitrophica bacterium CG11_big_fil_rev_8_21_14_0_20_45_26]PIW65164.1 MAG: 3-dehydroquinate synthase [Candidatus Omnitrophica bacterium CG12_big_fil_rev_8_21_14_0_65_45_16]
MKTVKVRLQSHAYDVRIGKGLIRQLGIYLKQLKAGPRILLVSSRDIVRQTRLTPFLSRLLTRNGFQVFHYEFVRGHETDKSIKGLTSLWRAMYQAKLDRSSTVIAVGGGVIGDVTGFAAATYLRGIRLVQIPTTLLSQVDSAIGGKTAIDFEGGKNLIGAFYQPALVVADIDLLRTLSADVFRDSFAEVVKYGVIQDVTLFKKLETKGRVLMDHVSQNVLNVYDFRFLEEVVYRCVRVKAGVVSRDERETKGLRTMLNYGHTFAHVLESLSNYRLTHGKAVGIGMVMAAQLSFRLGLVQHAFVDRQQALLRKMQLASSLGRQVFGKPVKRERVKALFFRDKKVSKGKIKLVLPTRLGQVKTVMLRPADWQYVHDGFKQIGL